MKRIPRWSDPQTAARIAVILLGVALGACGDGGDATSSPAPAIDAGPEGSAGTEGGAAPDAAPESSSPDVVTDGVADVAPETGTEAAVTDAGPDDAASEDAADGDGGGPLVLCPGGGLGGHLKVASAHWVVSPTLGNHYVASKGGFNAVHVWEDSLGDVTKNGPMLIVDMMSTLFKIPGQLAPDIDARLVALQKKLAGKESRIAAFYVYDEPYLDSHVTPRQVLEQGIAKLKAIYPKIPTYITFAHHCFDPSAPADANCAALPPSSRGIPSNVDWVGFDWYTDGACGGANTVEASFDCAVTGGVARMKKLTQAPILITPEAFDKFLDEAHVLVAAHLYHGLALSEPRVFGLDYFLYGTVPGSYPDPFKGLQDMPLARSTVRALNREILHACGEPDDGMVPVFEWWHSVRNERDYRGGFWSGWRAAGYAPQGVRFGLRANAEPGTVPMYRCDIAHGTDTDSGFLTVMNDCEGLVTKGPPTIIGYVSGSQKAGMLPLHRFMGPAPLVDHYYSTYDIGPPGYVLQGVVGYVTPGSSF